MGLDLKYHLGQTPIDEEEKEGLLIKTISLHKELDEFEQYNIEKAVEWTISRTFKKETLLTSTFIKKLHRRMFDEVWAWAGHFRKTDKNIGIAWPGISLQLQKLLDDARYWHERELYPPDEMAIRFKHRLVSIHCFPNGNGRHARLMADVLVENLYGRNVFTWGRTTMTCYSDTRKQYIASLKCADHGDIRPLLEFARS